MPIQEVRELQKQTRRRLKELMPIFARAAIGDFSKNITIPKTEDEFTDLYVGLQIMLEVIREQKAELQIANKRLQQTITERTADLIEVAAEKAKSDAILN